MENNGNKIVRLGNLEILIKKTDKKEEEGIVEIEERRKIHILTCDVEDTTREVVENLGSLEF